MIARYGILEGLSKVLAASRPGTSRSSQDRSGRRRKSGGRELPMWPCMVTLLLTSGLCTAQPVAVDPGLPSAPVPRGSSTRQSETAHLDSGAPASLLAQSSHDQQTSPGFPPVSEPTRIQPAGSSRQHPEIPSLANPCVEAMSQPRPVIASCAAPFDPYKRFVDTSGPHPLTVRQKGLLAIRNVTDPFNFLTIGAESALSVASDPGSPYGPGVPGFGRNFGVAYTETMVSSFFGTFLIPSIAHQDPHYHRLPHATLQRRILHAAVEVVWGQSDSGLGMVNYATIGDTAIGDALGNLYVPGRQKSWGAGVGRFATALASDPIDNLVTEFLPDVAKHVNVQIVLIQRVVNEVERQNGGT